jgi:flavin reductase (DIM6/NTAB) family NADH-FMN oxidoreductase RutF
MTSSPTFDARGFRDLGGRFATGVTVITATDGNDFRAMTANSVTTVSLEPPLMLVCVQHSASIHDPIARSRKFAINILSEGQEEISALFAHHGELDEPMGGVPFHVGLGGAPLIEGTLGWVECELWREYDGGDHTIYVGRVLELALPRPDARPLLFFAGGYRQLDGSAGRDSGRAGG